MLRALTKDTGILHLDLRCLCLDRKAAKRILQVGLPAGVQSTVFALSNVVIQSSINSFNSTAVVAGSATATSIEGFINTGCNAIHQTALTFSSQNYGAGKCKRVDKTIILCIIYATLIGLFLGNLAVFWGYHLASILYSGRRGGYRRNVTSPSYYLLNPVYLWRYGYPSGGATWNWLLLCSSESYVVRSLWYSASLDFYYIPDLSHANNTLSLVSN